MLYFYHTQTSPSAAPVYTHEIGYHNSFNDFFYLNPDGQAGAKRVRFGRYLQTVHIEKAAQAGVSRDSATCPLCEAWVVRLATSERVTSHQAVAAEAKVRRGGSESVMTENSNSTLNRANRYPRKAIILPLRRPRHRPRASPGQQPDQLALGHLFHESDRDCLAQKTSYLRFAIRAWCIA
jgi:hypothetical protein